MLLLNGCNARKQHTVTAQVCKAGYTVPFCLVHLTHPAQTWTCLALYLTFSAFLLEIACYRGVTSRFLNLLKVACLVRLFLKHVLLIANCGWKMLATVVLPPHILVACSVCLFQRLLQLAIATCNFEL